jgi:DNA end-binding protein Ku
MRSIWKGHIRFSLVTIPILVYNAIESKSNISFRQLHKKDNGRISYKKVCRECGDPVKKDNIVKGYEYQSDQYVVFTPEELDKVKLKSTRVIDIESFVDIEEVHPARFEAVYYLGPNGEVAQKTFSLFCKTLEKTRKAGVGRIILRDREDVVLMKAHKKGLIMYKLRYPHELRNIEKVPDLAEAEIDMSQLDLAETLVKSMSNKFSEVDFEDRYQEAIMDLVEQKVEGKEIVSISDEEEDKPVVDIMDALKESIERAKQMKKGA